MEISSKNMIIAITGLYVLLLIIPFALLNQHDKSYRNKLQSMYLIMSAVIFFFIVKYLLDNNCESTESFVSPYAGLCTSFRELKTVLVVADWCGYSKKAIHDIRQNNLSNCIKVVNEDDEDYNRLQEKYNIEAFPVWISEQNETSQSGYITNLELVVKALNEKSETEENNNEDLKQQCKVMGLILFEMDGCGFCKKAVADLKAGGYLESGKEAVKVVNADQVGNYISDSEKRPRAFPAWYNPNNDKQVLGYMPIGNVLKRVA